MNTEQRRRHLPVRYAISGHARFFVVTFPKHSTPRYPLQIAVRLDNNHLRLGLLDIVIFRPSEHRRGARRRLSVQVWMKERYFARSHVTPVGQRLLHP